MSTNINLKSAERNSLALNFRDGLWDMLLGSFLVALAFQGPLEQNGTAVWLSYMPAAGIMLVGLAGYWLAKRKLVVPRIGIIKISLRHSKTRRWMLGLAIGLQLITLLIFVLGMSGWLGKNLGGQPHWLVDAFFGVLAFSFFAFLGYTMDTPRLYLYGLALGLSMPLGVLIRSESQVVNTLPMLAAGGVMLVGGGIALALFLNRYPLYDEGGAHG